MRKTLASYLRVTRMMPVDPKQIIIINGSHQAIDLCARLLADHGDRAWLEDPGYWGARNLAVIKAGVKSAKEGHAIDVEEILKSGE